MKRTPWSIAPSGLSGSRWRLLCSRRCQGVPHHPSSCPSDRNAHFPVFKVYHNPCSSHSCQRTPSQKTNFTVKIFQEMAPSRRKSGSPHKGGGVMLELTAALHLPNGPGNFSYQSLPRMEQTLHLSKPRTESKLFCDLARDDRSDDRWCRAGACWTCSEASPGAARLCLTGAEPQTPRGPTGLVTRQTPV